MHHNRDMSSAAVVFWQVLRKNILCVETGIIGPLRNASCINNPKKWSWVRGDQGLVILKVSARCIQIKEAQRRLPPNTV